MSVGDWRTAEWEHVADFGKPHLSYIEITIRAMKSPFYGGERYAVRRGDKTVLNLDSEWEHEPIPSSRDDAFYERCRFKTFDEAVEAADAARQAIIESFRIRPAKKGKS